MHIFSTGDVVAYKYTQPSSQAQSSVSDGRGGATGSGQLGPSISNQGQMDESGLSQTAQQGPIRELPGGLVDKIKKRLSTSWRDWVVSKEDAEWVMAELNRLSLRQVGQVVSELGEDHIEHLLKATPMASMPVSYVTKVVTALGPDRVAPFCDAMMSRGAFDWFISDEDAKAVGRIVEALPEAQRTELLKHMDEDKVERLMRNLNSDYMLGEVVSARFDVDFGTARDLGSQQGRGWSVEGLRETWEVLEDLPEAHVGGNPSLGEMGRYEVLGNEGGSGGGYYEPATGNIGIQYADNRLDEEYWAGGWNEEGDAIVGAQVFEHTVRHEIGHAVDEQINGFGRLTSRASGGGWKEHGGSDLLGIVSQIVDETSGPISRLMGDERATILSMIADEMGQGSPDGLSTALADSWVAHDLGAGWAAEMLTDDALEVVKVGMDKPWFAHPDGGIAVKGRIYQRSYSGHWTSYNAESRQSLVSRYQFRAPGEWFAEVYANYYDPRNEKPGDMLSAIDPLAKKWFDRNVQAMRNVEEKWDRKEG